ncbi:MAG: hypothetical protein EXS09_19945 [Gemmataceae bacterium]|nr:hypothetical protein [Gemmataceae bacterium]
MAAILAEADRKPRPPRLRQQPLTRHSHVSPPGGSADPMNMTVDELRNQIEQVKADLDWANTTGSARTWWEDFENANIERLPLVLKLAEDLHQLKATIHEFFLAYASSNIDSIQGNLNYLAYLRFKKGEEQKKRGKRRNKT